MVRRLQSKEVTNYINVHKARRESARGSKVTKLKSYKVTKQKYGQKCIDKGQEAYKDREV